MAKQIYLLTHEGELALEYQVVDRTNILGWDFPLEFRLAQYRELRLPGEAGTTNRWHLDFLARGKVTSVVPAQFSPSEEASNRDHPPKRLLIRQPEWNSIELAARGKVIEEEGKLSVLSRGYYSPLFHIDRMWGVVVSTTFPEYKNGEYRLLTVPTPATCSPMRGLSRLQNSADSAAHCLRLSSAVRCLPAHEN